MFTKEMINNYADKLLIGLTEEECNTLLDEFDVIKENMELIDSIDNLENIEPMHYPTDYEIDNLRDTNAESNLETSDVISNSDGVIEDMIKVPKVVG